ncbi:hypothetical protein ACLMJK_008155 [Lecanora helva]
MDVILVTGSNAGLGYEIIRALCRSNKPYNILLSGRSLPKVQQAITSVKEEYPSSTSTISPLQIDIEDDGSIHRAFEEVQAKFGKVDALVNNAGIYQVGFSQSRTFSSSSTGGQLDQQLASGTMTMRQMWNQSWSLNTASTQVMTSTFMPLLLQSSNPRLLFIASGTSTLTGTDNLVWPFNKSPSKGWPKPELGIGAYRASKTGMNMMMREWYRILKEDGVKVWCISPGFLATGLGGNQEANQKAGAGDPAVGGEFVREVVEGQRDGDVGKVITRQGVQAW